MANVGPLEILVVLLIALIVFGPRRLPELGKSLGDGLRGFKEALSEGEHGSGQQEAGAEGESPSQEASSPHR